MKTMLANDLVLQEENCNLSCRYCLTGQSNFKAEHSAQLIFHPPRPAAYAADSPLRQRVDRLLAQADTGLDLPIIKVTGGEIFLIHGIMDLLRRLAARFATLVIQTNGVLLTPPQIAEIASWSNTHVQLSLDAMSYEGNGYRCTTVNQHTKVLEALARVLDAGIPTEIYCVLNNRSLPALIDTLDALKPYGGRLTIFPFPVRGPDRDEFAARPEQFDVLRRLEAIFDDYASILPPRPYLTRLRRFYAEGARTFRCHLPRFVFSTFDDGVLTSCPNIWFDKVGNLLNEDAGDVIGRIGETPFYQLLLAEKPRIDACKACFTPWDTLSMYVDGEITLDELCCPPSIYAAPESRERIDAITRAYRAGQPRAEYRPEC
jgi:MoaA/NifB/PqqE/SkfB family radical SAM enzyme